MRSCHAESVPLREMAERGGRCARTTIELELAGASKASLHGAAHRSDVRNGTSKCSGRAGIR